MRWNLTSLIGIVRMVNSSNGFDIHVLPIINISILLIIAMFGVIYRYKENTL